MYVFLGVTDDVERLTRRIRRVLGSRPAVHIDELRMRLAMDKASIQAALEAMMARGEIERLRPIDCSRDDHDFYRVNRPVTMWVKAPDRGGAHTANSGQENVRLSGLAVACLAD
jgi:hypothetical protein